MNWAKTIEASTKDTTNLSGYKVIQVNVSDASENLYAVVTPVKNKD